MRNTVRFWFFTDGRQVDSRGSDVSITLCGALGEVSLSQLEQAAPAAGGTLFGAGKRCEICVETDFVGTLNAVRVGYGTRISSGDCPPWCLRQVVVRTSADGMVASFVLAGDDWVLPGATVDLERKMVWHEDRFGNISEAAPPPAPPAASWIWPQHVTAAAGDFALCEAIWREAVAPLVDEAQLALEHERTPGTFRNACRQAAQGQPLSLGLSSPVLSRELTNGARRWAEPKDAAAPKASAPGKGGRPNLEVKVPRDSSRTCVVS